MERWYLPILCHGRAEMRLEQLSRYVQQNQLYDLVPVAFLERKPRSQFYLFMAINSEPKSQIPDRLRSLVHQLGHPLTEAVEREEIEKMVSGPINPHDYARRIAYRIQQENVYEDPFDLYSAASEPRKLGSYERNFSSSQYDKLLYWLSSAGHGTWQLFKNSCKTLDLDDGRTKAQSILRRLRLLGHIEVSHDGSYWSVCPSCLVTIRHELAQEYVLTGQRSIKLLEMLRRLDFIQFSFIEQPDSCAPKGVRLQILSEDLLNQLQNEIGSFHSLRGAGNVGNKLAEILPSLDVWLEHLPTVGKFVIALYNVEQFANGLFEPGVFQGKSGMYRLIPRDRNDQGYQTLFYHQNSDRWVRGDWYGLRFLALRYANVPCRAVYHLTSHLLAIPVSQQWPEIYERALVLSSGQLPEEKNDWLFFENISPDVAQQLSAKLTIAYEEIH
jgi:hypothetical protein